MTFRAGMDAEHREGRPKLSLRRFFSAMGLNSVGLLGKGRSSSMDQLSLHPKPNSNSNQNLRPTSPSTSPSPTHRHHHQLKKAPSLQTIRLVSIFCYCMTTFRSPSKNIYNCFKVSYTIEEFQI